MNEVEEMFQLALKFASGEWKPVPPPPGNPLGKPKTAVEEWQAFQRSKEAKEIKEAAKQARREDGFRFKTF